MLFIFRHCTTWYHQRCGYRADSNPLSNASVEIKNTKRATVTNAQGEFAFANVQQSNVALIISYVGYIAQEVNASAGSVVNLTLQESKNENDEVVVAGVFDRRTRMSASVAITTLNAA